MFELVSPSLEAKIFWDNVQFVGMFAGPMAVLAFAYQYTGRRLSHPKRTWGLLAIVPIISLLLVFTDDLHGLIRPAAWLVPGEPFSALVYDFSISFWAMCIYVYGLVLPGLWVLIIKYIRSHRLYRAQVGTIIAGVLMPLVGGVLTLMDITFTFHRDTTPITFAVGHLIVAWALFRYRLFDVVPVARDAVIEGMSDVVVVLDAQSRVVDLNPAAGRIIGWPAEETIGQPAAQVLSAWPNWFDHYNDVTEARAEIVLGEGEARSFYDMRISPLYNRRDRLASRLFVLRDITERKRAEKDLRESEKLLRATLESTADGILVVNEEGQITLSNALFAEMWRIPEELIATRYDAKLLDYVLDQLIDPEAFLTKVWELYESDKESFDTLLFKDGRVFERYSRPLIRTGIVAGRVWSFQDVTARVKAEEESRKRTESLEDARKAALSLMRDAEMQRQRAEEALEALWKSEADLSRAQAIAHLGSYSWNIQTGEISWSDELKAIWGYTEEPSFDLVTLLIHPDDRESILEARRLAREKDHPFNVEYRIVRSDGSMRYVHDQAEVTRNEAGSPIQMFGTVHDITRRKRAEETLEKHNRALQTLHQVTLDIGSELKMPTLLRSIMERAVNLLDADRGGGIYLYYADGNVLRLAEGSGINEGRVGAVIQLNEGMSGRVFQSAQPLIVNDYTNWEGRATVLVSWTPSAVMGVPLLWDGQVIGVLGVFADSHRRTFDQEDVQLAEMFAAQAVLTIRNTQLYEQAQQEIIERKEMEKELISAKEAAEVANRAKSTFLANMSHEIRTPLNAILGFTQLMCRDPAFTPAQWENLHIIQRSGEYLLELINDILEMSKIEAGRTTFAEIDFDLHHLLGTLESIFAIRAQAKGLQLYFECAPDVPQHVRTDERKLRQALINLLSNAVKFTEEGSVTLRVQVGQGDKEIGRQGDQEAGEVAPSLRVPVSLCLHFEIEDTGVGIAPEEMDRLFETFTQTTSGQEVLEGTGLGLALSQRFVQLMGGDITVESQVGQGSVFQFDIQVVIAEASAVQAQQPDRLVVGLAPMQRSADDGAADGGPYRILVAEDKEASRMLLVKLLEVVGFEVHAAANGEEAIAAWEAWEPHLIWMDMRMPVMDGYEATRRIKATTKGQATTIIAVTASLFEEERVVALSVGCDDFVRKPFREADIFDKMAQHLGVRYVYEDLAPSAEPGSTTQEQTDLTLADLVDLPADWIAELHHAAARAHARRIISLIEQIQPDHAPVAQALAMLVRDFRFDRIMSLTEQRAEQGG